MRPDIRGTNTTSYCSLKIHYSPHRLPTVIPNSCYERKDSERGGNHSHEGQSCPWIKLSFLVMRSSRVVSASCYHCKVANVLGSIPASSDTMETEGWQMKQF